MAVDKYELAKVKGSKVIHLMVLSGKTYITSCSQKTLKNSESFEYDLEGVTCKNCLNSPTYAALIEMETDPEAGEKKVEDPKVIEKDAAIVAKQKKSSTKKSDGMKEIKETHTLVFCAATKKQSPLLTVVAPDIDAAKGKIEFEMKKTSNMKDKFQKWQDGGRVIVSRYVPNEMLKPLLSQQSKQASKAISRFDIQGQMQIMAKSLNTIAEMSKAFPEILRLLTVATRMFYLDSEVEDLKAEMSEETEVEVKQERVIYKWRR